jgi:hypothetical protein
MEFQSEFDSKCRKLTPPNTLFDFPEICPSPANGLNVKCACTAEDPDGSKNVDRDSKALFWLHAISQSGCTTEIP